MTSLFLAHDMQSEKSKKAGNGPTTDLLIEFLTTSYKGCLELVLLEEDMNFNQRATSITVSTSISSAGERIFDINLCADCYLYSLFLNL